MDFDAYLRAMVEQEGSDLFLSTGAFPSAKIMGKLIPLEQRKMRPGEVKDIAYTIMDQEQIAEFEQKPEANIAISRSGVGRFRVNVFKQRNEVSMVARSIVTDIPHFHQLGLPDVLKKLILQKHGLVLFVGGTGSGKSTSLASLIDYRNTNSAGHIITIEDPVEFVHTHKQSIVNQREVGSDTDSYEDALQNTLRQAPDVILIGEIRSAETMEHALAFAETGHLCLSTLHANNANQALDRIINFFPEERHKQLFLDMSLNMRGIVSQRLIPTLDSKRAAAVEVLLGTPRVCDLIKQGKIDDIKEVMTKGEAQGMQTFDSALYRLYTERKISLEETLKSADSKNNLRLRISLEESGDAAVNEAQSSNASTKAETKTRPKAQPRPEQKAQAKPGPAEEKKPASPSPELSLEPMKKQDDEDDEGVVTFFNKSN